MGKGLEVVVDHEECFKVHKHADLGRQIVQMVL